MPVGGHIEENETPDRAVKREVKEEVGLDIELLGQSKVNGTGGHKQLAQPFHVDMHSVGDHDHVCFYYAAKPLGEEISIREEEVNEARWFEEDELGEVPADVATQARRALEIL